MKKIGLYLGSDLSGGGAFQYGLAMIDAVAALQGKDYNALVAYSSLPWAGILKEHNVSTFYIPLRAYEMNIALWWRRLGLSTNLWRNIARKFHTFTKCFIQAKCDLWIFPSQDIWAYRVPVPALTTIYDLMHRYERRFAEVSAYGRYKRREAHYRDICKWSKGILVDSNIGKQQVVESYGVQPDKIHVLPFIPPKHIYSSKIPAGLDSRYSLPEKFIFYPAQLWSHKNHSALIRAAVALKDKLPDLKLVFVGAKKNGYDAVARMVSDLGLDDSVFFLGYVPDEDIAEIYRRARAMVMPTFFGPTNIPPLEAFALGCPVAVSRIYSMPEQVGDAALLFDPSSEEEIADIIYKLWVDDILCRSLIEKGLRKASAWGQTQFNERLKEIVAMALTDMDDKK